MTTQEKEQRKIEVVTDWGVWITGTLVTLNPGESNDWESLRLRFCQRTDGTYTQTLDLWNICAQDLENLSKMFSVFARVQKNIEAKREKKNSIKI